MFALLHFRSRLLHYVTAFFYSFRYSLFEAVFPGVGRDPGRILSVKAGAAVMLVAGELPETFHGKKAKGICTDDIGNLGHGMVAGDQVVPRVDVSPIIAGMEKRRGGDPHVNFLCSCGPEERDDTAAGGTADDRVVDQDDAFAFDDRVYSRKLDVHLTGAITWRDEGSSDVFVFDKANLVGNPGGTAVAEGCVQTGIRDADHEIRRYRVCLGQNLAGFHASGMYRSTVDHGVRAGKIDVFKNAELLTGCMAVLPAGGDAVLRKNQDLTWLDIPHKPGTDSGERTAFGRHDIYAVRGYSVAEWAETVRVSGAEKLLRGH